VRLDRLWLSDFRSYASADLELAPGLTALVGANGQGKSNLVEAIAYLASLASFRGAPADALVRVGAARAVLRAEGERAGRSLMLEAEINRVGRNRVLVNRQRLPRARELLGALRVTVFAPDDLMIVKGGPSERRAVLDGLLVALAPRHDALIGEVDRVLRQRNALLKQTRGRPDESAMTTLDVWDAKLAAAGEALADARSDLVARLGPAAAAAHARVTARDDEVTLTYEASWREAGLAAALDAARRDDLRRGVTTVGPHRDDLAIGLRGLSARTHASQGEQRSLALALRLAGHDVVTDEVGAAPVLLLDDVFSELDPSRSAALLAHLPAGQAVLTTAGPLPPGAHPELTLRIDGGTVQPIAA
jgi:DNA replication and repair protein RecF